MAGPIYGIFKNIASGKFGTQEGIRIADQAASEMMQKLTYEPESKSLTNFMSAVGDIATKYKLDAAIPQLLTVPIPGPASSRYAGVKTGEEIVDLMERQYAKQREAGEFGERNPLRDILLPTRKEITQSAPPPRSSEPKPVEKNELGLSSKLLETTKGLKQRKGTADQLLGQLKKTLGKENKEIKDSGIEAFLADKKKVNADEVEEFIRQNQPKFVERVGKGESAFKMKFSEGVALTPEETYGYNYINERAYELMDEVDTSQNEVYGATLDFDDAVKMAEEEYYENPLMKYVEPKTGYTITGNDNVGYSIFETESESNSRENAFATSGGRKRYDMRRDESGDLEIYSLDEAEVQARGLAENQGDLSMQGDTRWSDYVEPDGENYQELRFQLDDDEVKFTEGVHFPDDKNNIFHVRTTDRVYDGTQDESMPKPRKVLYVEELQSDWAQTGRREGFELSEEEKKPLIKDSMEKVAEMEKEILEVMKERPELAANPSTKLPVDTKSLNAYFNREAISSDFQRYTYNPKDIKPDTKVTLRELIENSIKTLKQSRLEESTNNPNVKDLGYSNLAYNFTDIIMNLAHNLQQEFINNSDFAKSLNIPPEFAEKRSPSDSNYEIYPQLKVTNRFAPMGKALKKVEDLNEKTSKNYWKTTGKVSRAPFVTDTDSWTQLGIKKLLTKAVDEGYDYVSFSPGHVQYKRWDEDGLIEYYDKIIPKNARKVVDKIDKEAIVKLDGNRFKTEDGEGLDADESVLNPFYDSEELDFPEPEYGAILPRFSIKITPKLKEKILKEGLPSYKKGGEVSKDTATIIELMKR